MKLPFVQCRRSMLTAPQLTFVDSDWFETIWLGPHLSGFTVAMAEAAFRNCSDPRFSGLIIDAGSGHADDGIAGQLRHRTRGHDVAWCGRTGSYRFPQGGRLVIRRLKQLTRDDLQGCLYTFIGVDGLWGFDTETYTRLVSRMRVVDAGVRPRVAVAGCVTDMSDGPAFLSMLGQGWTRITGTDARMWGRNRVITRVDSYGRQVPSVLPGGEPVWVDQSGLAIPVVPVCPKTSVDGWLRVDHGD